MEKIDAIFLIGPQGSGKGTQARRLAEKLGFFYWEMSSIIKESANAGTEKGARYLNLIHNGILLSDADVIDIIKDKLATFSKSQGIVFDGLIRRIGQAKYIVETMRQRGQSSLVTLFITLPKAESVERLLRRSEIEHRPDDAREKIETRLNLYEQETLPSLDYMRSETKFITIDGRPSIEEVTVAINKQLGLE